MNAIMVKDLIKALKEQDQNALVALSTDSEGNGFSLMPDEEFISIGFMTEELGYNEFEEKKKKGTKPTIVLWGSN